MKTVAADVVGMLGKISPGGVDTRALKRSGESIFRQASFSFRQQFHTAMGQASGTFGAGRAGAFKVQVTLQLCCILRLVLVEMGSKLRPWVCHLDSDP